MNDRRAVRPPAVNLLLTFASFVVIVAGMRAAAIIIIPFLLSVFIAIVSGPPLFWLRRRGFSTTVSLGVVILAITLLGMLAIGILGRSINDFTRALPAYQQRLQGEAARVVGWLDQWLDRFDFEIPWKEEDSASPAPEVSPVWEEPPPDFGLGDQEPRPPKTPFDAGLVMRMIGGMIASIGSAITNAFMILVTAIFILLEASSFPNKLRAILKDPDRTMPFIEDFLDSVQRYMAIKTFTSALTGGALGLGLALLGVDYPFLWGMLAFFFNYVPNIGSVIAAIPPCLLAFIQLGTSEAVAAVILYLIVNTLIGYIIEPRMMGRGVGLSTLVVFLSLVFWGWVLGPVGMLLSVPLTMTFKIGLASNENTRWISILLDDEVTEAELREIAESRARAREQAEA